MALGEFLLDVVVDFVVHAAAAVLEWLVACGRRAAGLLRRARRTPPPGA